MNNFNFNNFQLNKWFSFSFKNKNINNSDIQNNVIIPSIYSYKYDVIDPLLKNGYINGDMRVNIIAKASNGYTFKSIITLQTIEIKNILNLKEIMLGHYNTFHADNYISDDFKLLVFNFRIISQDFRPNIKPKILNVEDHIKFKDKNFNQQINNVKLPLTMDLYKWGNVKFDDDYTEAVMIINDLEYFFTIHKSYYECLIKTINDDIIIKFRDTLLNNHDLTNFKREIIIS